MVGPTWAVQRSVSRGTGGRQAPKGRPPPTVRRDGRQPPGSAATARSGSHRDGRQPPKVVRSSWTRNVGLGRHPSLGASSEPLVEGLSPAVGRQGDIELPRVGWQVGRNPVCHLRQRLPFTSKGRVNCGGSGRVEMAKPPRLWLRVVHIEVLHQLLVAEVPKAGAVIRHSVGVAWEVERPLLIAKHALVHRLEPQQIGGRPRAGRCPLG